MDHGGMLGMRQLWFQGTITVKDELAKKKKKGRWENCSWISFATCGFFAMHTVGLFPRLLFFAHPKNN